MSLIEVLVAVAILSAVAVAFLYGISTVLRANAVAETQSKALTLAESQLESVKGEPYVLAPPGGEAHYSKIASGGYTISTINSTLAIDNGTYVCGLPWNDTTETLTGNDTGLQKITVIIQQGAAEILRVSTFKVKLN